MNSQKDQEMDAQLQAKLDKSRAILRSLRSVVVAFSAGVDSTFLLALATETLGAKNVLAVMGISPSLPQRERDAGQQLAREIGVELAEIETTELSDPNYASNPTNRCFYCKQELFVRLGKLAGERGFQTVVSGANADDTGDFRPGLEAGRLLDVRTPLLEAGLTKDDIRVASRTMGLKTWNKPAAACLASRIPYGQQVTAERLHRVELAEGVLKDLGLRQCRVRDHDLVARIEVPCDDLYTVVEARDRIVEALKGVGYAYVTLDLQGFRSGSMNEILAQRQAAGERISSD